MLKDLEPTAILWDFDGVLIDSESVRIAGFREVLKDFPEEQVDRLICFHKANGGLSRYVKFRHFFEEIRCEKITQDEVMRLSGLFADIMRVSLTSPERLISETVEFVRRNHRRYPMHIVSGSDGDELRYLCGKLGIAHYFRSIEGSPTPKNELVRNLMQSTGYPPDGCMLIGDSHNDREAAVLNGIAFVGYNNAEVESLSDFKFDFND